MLVLYYLEFFIEQGMDALIYLFNSFELFNGVTWLSLNVAVSLLCYFIGSVILRV